MGPDKAKQVADYQRRRFNEMVDVFDTSQPEHVMARLRQIVAEAELQPGEIVLDVGTGVGVLLPLIASYHPSLLLACDLAEKMLQRLQKKHRDVRCFQCDIVWPPLKEASVDVVFLNAMFGNIADKPRACRNLARILRSGGRLVVSHPEGKEFVDHLRATSDLVTESLPSEAEFGTMLAPLGLEVIAYRDAPGLYVLVARKRE